MGTTVELVSLAKKILPEKKEKKPQKYKLKNNQISF